MLCPHQKKPCRTLPGSTDFFQATSGAVYYAGARSLNYGDDYFLQEYQNQYGRTYLEDESNLRRLARSRLEDLLLPHCRSGDLLEIGCATGFFLAEARAAGFTASGLEISPYASKIARQSGFQIWNASFLDFQSESVYDVLAAFYVLEHFPDQSVAFARIASLLRPGGFFLFALPSTHGPLFEYHLADWCRTHPVDHFADYSPAALREILPAYGLRLLQCRPASYHPERSAGLRRLSHRISPELYRWWARQSAYGDTMEGIAIKI